MIDYEKLNPILREESKRYVEHGDVSGLGHFLTAVICNDLTNAICYAGETQLACIADTVRWWYNQPPSNCHGSKEKMMKWHKAGGLVGFETKSSNVKSIITFHK